MKTTFVKNLVLGLVVTFVFFVLMELVLMAAGVTPLYTRTDTSVGFAGYAPLFVKQAQPGGEEYYSTAPNKLQWFNMQNFPASKADGVTRIFCIGGSTTYGRPYDDRTSFCGWLRLFLKAADTTRRWEVINAGGISYASYRAARLMEELADYEPDLFIVYSGHNEFLEARTYNKLLKVPGFFRSLAVQASRTRLYSLLYDLVNEPGTVLTTEVDALLDHSVGPEDYHRDDEMRTAILEDYQSSLLRMTHISERTGAKMILVTPASNIGDFGPFKSEPGHDLSANDISQVDTLKVVAASALHEGNYIFAEAVTREGLAIDGRDPELFYLYGQALRALERMDEARRAFIKSRDEDVCPLRALTPVREIVADVAHKNKTGFVDFVDIVNEYSPDGIPGSELFLDHVHPTIEGNRMLALAILREMEQEGIVTPSANWNEDLIADISRELENSLDERTHADALRKLSRVLTWAGKHDEAERLINQAVAMIPEDSKTHIQKGVLLWREGDREAALVHFREAEHLDPMNAGIHHRLGLLLSELGRPDEARPELEEAIRLDPKLANAHYDLGIVLQALGNMKQAEAAYRTALIMDPDNAKAYNNLGVILAQSGNFTAAEEQFAKALQLDPDNAEAAANLARARKALDLLQSGSIDQ
jgi:Flp pilus assembly protein TadD